MNRRAVLRTFCAVLAADAIGPSFAAEAPATRGGKAAAGFKFGRGVVVAHWLGRNIEPDFPYAGAWFDDEDVAWIAAQGFDHIQVHVDGHQWIDAAGKLREENVAHFMRALEWARRHGIGVVLGMSSLPGYRVEWRAPVAPGSPTPFSDDKMRRDAQHLWRLVAKQFANAGEELRFAALLDPPGSAEPAQVQALHKAMLAAIREMSPKRIVYLASRDMALRNAGEVELADEHTILALHFVEPRGFTVQYPRERGPQPPPVRFPGKVPDLSAFAEREPALAAISGKTLTVAGIEAEIAGIASWQRTQARKPEIYIASFGVMRFVDDDSARNYIRAVRTAFERLGFTWCVYDYFSGMAVRDPEGKSTRILEALDLQTKL